MANKERIENIQPGILKTNNYLITNKLNLFDVISGSKFLSIDKYKSS